MSKKILIRNLALIAFGVALIVGNIKADDVNPSIKVIAPNGGGVWEAGKTYRVAWESTGYDKLMAAVVCENDIIGPYYNIVQQTADKGSYVFNLKSNQVGQNRCKAVVAESLIGDLENIEQGVNGDYSDKYFSIDGVVMQGLTAAAGQSIGAYLKSQANLIRETNTNKIYKIIDNKKLFLPAEVFYKIGYNLLDVQDVSKAVIDKYERLKLAEAPNSLTMYYLTEGGQKKHIQNAEMFNFYEDNNWEDLVVVDKEILNALSDVNLIKLENTYNVYELNNGKKKWIQTPKQFIELGYDWGLVALVNQSEFDYYDEQEYEQVVEQSQISGDAKEEIEQRDILRVSGVRQLALALDLYYDDNNVYPSSLFSVVAMKYLAELPKDPVTDSNYSYIQLFSGNGYHIGAQLEDLSNVFLKSDVDYNSTIAGGFDGQDPVYDMGIFE